jgi:hypothetical protein
LSAANACKVASSVWQAMQFSALTEAMSTVGVGTSVGVIGVGLGGTGVSVAGIGVGVGGTGDGVGGSGVGLGGAGGSVGCATAVGDGAMATSVGWGAGVGPLHTVSPAVATTTTVSQINVLAIYLTFITEPL